MPPTEFRFDDLDLRVEPERARIPDEGTYLTVPCVTSDTCGTTRFCTISACTGC